MRHRVGEHLRQLADEVNEACSAATLDGGDIAAINISATAGRMPAG